MHKCAVCGVNFITHHSSHYVAKDNNKLYDAYDCPICGAQFIAQERKEGSVKPGDIRAAKLPVSYREYSSANRLHRLYADLRAVYGKELRALRFESGEEAQEVLRSILAIHEWYGTVTVADIFDIVDGGCNCLNDRYGYRNIESIRVVMKADGPKTKYAINFPDPAYLG